VGFFWFWFFSNWFFCWLLGWWDWFLSLNWRKVSRWSFNIIMGSFLVSRWSFNIIIGSFLVSRWSFNIIMGSFLVTHLLAIFDIAFLPLLFTFQIFLLLWRSFFQTSSHHTITHFRITRSSLSTRLQSSITISFSINGISSFHTFFPFTNAFCSFMWLFCHWCFSYWSFCWWFFSWWSFSWWSFSWWSFSWWFVTAWRSRWWWWGSIFIMTSMLFVLFMANISTILLKTFLPVFLTLQGAFLSFTFFFFAGIERTVTHFSVAAFLHACLQRSKTFTFCFCVLHCPVAFFPLADTMAFLGLFGHHRCFSYRFFGNWFICHWFICERWWSLGVNNQQKRQQKKHKCLHCCDY